MPIGRVHQICGLRGWAIGRSDSPAEGKFRRPTELNVGNATNTNPRAGRLRRMGSRMEKLRRRFKPATLVASKWGVVCRGEAPDRVGGFGRAADRTGGVHFNE